MSEYDCSQHVRRQLIMRFPELANGSLQPIDAVSRLSVWLKELSSAGGDTGGALDPAATTWTDPKTGLMWMREALPLKHGWREAKALPGEFNANGGNAGHSDWRLPTTKELKHIVVGGDGQACPFRGDVFRGMAEAIMAKRFDDLVFWTAPVFSFLPPVARLAIPLRTVDCIGTNCRSRVQLVRAGA